MLGRPLDLVFDVGTDGAALADACVQAEVVAGDVPLSANQVRVTPLAPRAGRGSAIRVQTTQPISEPVLSVRLAAGCAGSVVRTYAVLAYPAESLSARQLAAVNAGAVRARPAASPDPQAEPAQSSGRTARTQAKTAPARQSGERPKRALSAPRAAASRTPVEPGRPRLVMEPLTDWLEAPSVLRASPEIATLSPASPSQREEAAARWRALNMQPQEMLEEAARLLQQETQLTKQLAQAERDKVTALQLQQELRQRADERFSSTVVYVLVALLLLLAGALLWLWSRGRAIRLAEERSWTQTPAPSGAANAQAAAPAYVDLSARLQPTEPELLPSGMVPLEFGPSLSAGVEPAVQARPAAFAASAPAAPVTAVVNPEDLFDLQQQAEFFVSVGEHDQAIDVMKQHIEANQASSPLAYLELLRLYRSLSRIEQFNALREQFHRHFNAQVPEFAAFARQGKTLFGYPEVLARIEVLWCDPSVVVVLQELLFRSVGQDHQRFDLPAYDDLLLLHAISRTTPASSRGIASPRTRTTPQEPEQWLAPQAELPESASSPVGNLMEFEPDWDFEAPAKAPSETAVNPATELDLDLSDFTHLDVLSEQKEVSAPLPLLTQEEQPRVPSTEPPDSSQPVGFGSNSDRFEARADPDARKRE